MRCTTGNCYPAKTEAMSSRKGTKNQERKVYDILDATKVYSIGGPSNAFTYHVQYEGTLPENAIWVPAERLSVDPLDPDGNLGPNGGTFTYIKHNIAKLEHTYKIDWSMFIILL